MIWRGVLHEVSVLEPYLIFNLNTQVYEKGDWNESPLFFIFIKLTSIF